MRKKQVYKREEYLDPKYKNVLIGKFINHIMKNGKKSVAVSIIYDAFDIISEVTKKDPISVFNQAIKNVSPTLEIKGRRIGGANYQIPFEVRGSRKNALAMRWILEVARGKKGQMMAKKLSSEIIEASKGQGSAIKKKEDVQRMAIANKAFAHYAR
jgi:small subunit ribosomal protein S7